MIEPKKYLPCSPCYVPQVAINPHSTQWKMLFHLPIRHTPFPATRLAVESAIARSKVAVESAIPRSNLLFQRPRSNLNNLQRHRSRIYQSGRFVNSVPSPPPIRAHRALPLLLLSAVLKPLWRPNASVSKRSMPVISISPEYPAR